MGHMTHFDHLRKNRCQPPRKKNKKKIKKNQKNGSCAPPSDRINSSITSSESVSHALHFEGSHDSFRPPSKKSIPAAAKKKIKKKKKKEKKWLLRAT